MNDFDFIGVDIAKDKFDVCLLSKSKTKTAIFENNKVGFKRFVTWAKMHAKTLWVCMEATGIYGEKLAEYLTDETIKVSVVNPMRIKHYGKALLTRNKNDVVDAKIIALYAQAMKPDEFTPRDAKQKEVKETVQLLDVLRMQRQQAKNQLESASCKSVKAELKKLIRSLDARIAAIEKKLKSKTEQNSELASMKKALMSIKGIGELTAHALIAHLPDIKLFNNAKQLAAYAGLSPRQHQSGTFAGRTKLSKIGNAKLRRALYMPALVAKNSNPYLKPFCQRLQSNGLKPKAIICAVMRKLLHIIFGMLKNKQEFNPALV